MHLAADFLQDLQAALRLGPCTDRRSTAITVRALGLAPLEELLLFGGGLIFLH